MARRLFETAYASKKAALKAGDLSGGRMGPFWDRLVFSKIKARLGGAQCRCWCLSECAARHAHRSHRLVALQLYEHTRGTFCCCGHRRSAYRRAGFKS